MSSLQVMDPKNPPRCPRCGELPRFVELTARVRCDLDYSTGRVGDTDHIGRRMGPLVFICGGSHTWTPELKEEESSDEQS